MGAIFDVPVFKASAIDQLPGTTIALVPDEGPPLPELCRISSDVRNQIDKVPLTLLIGAERQGLPEDVVAQADQTARIPIASHSLNAAMAATVALYEVTRMAPAP
jgi:TrmH family RNA methyltransferase